MSDNLPGLEPVVEGPPALLATCSYTLYQPSMGLAVCTSVGRPRFWSEAKHGKLAMAQMAAPWGKVDGVDLRKVPDQAVFEIHYRRRLDAKAGEISAQLKKVANDNPGRRLVLLCYEDVRKPGVWCHRRILAAWLEEHTGIAVPELSVDL